jgi:hypothetical protein
MVSGQPASVIGTAPRGRAMWRWTAAALILLVAIALRLIGTRGDLWLDEIWTLVLLEPVTSVGQVIWSINHDNNHYLNSLYLYLVGADASPLVQRALSVVFGKAAVGAAGIAAIRGGWVNALTAMLLFAVSYPICITVRRRGAMRGWCCSRSSR